MSSLQAVIGSPGSSIAPLRRVVLEGGHEDLTRRAAGGCRKAFSALMTAHKEDLYRFVRRRLADPEEAYDIVQKAFVSAWCAIDRFDPQRPFEAWLRSIALNKCRDHARRAFVRKATFGASPVDGVDSVREEGASPEEVLIARDELAALSRAMEALPQHLRDALMLTTVDGLSQAAAAAALGCSIKAIEYRVSRARGIIAQKLDLRDRRNDFMAK
jgi:RNA polymerase sigma-70 factor (ECF subfamily)